jgi:hypothetical protein
VLRVHSELPELHVLIVDIVEEVHVDPAGGVVVVDHEAAQAVGGEENLPLEASHRGGLRLAGDLLPLLGVTQPEAIPPLQVPLVLLL